MACRGGLLGRDGGGIYEDVFAFEADGIAFEVAEGWGFEQGAGCEVEGAGVPGADEAAVADGALLERCFGMRALGLHGEEGGLAGGGVGGADEEDLGVAEGNGFLGVRGQVGEGEGLLFRHGAPLRSEVF